MNLSVFQYSGKEVRTTIIDGKPWFVAKDLCEILGIANVSHALSKLDDDERNTIVLNDGTAGNPTTSIVSESGMYALVLRSRKPEAKSFRKWVTSEVLPSISRTGSYSIAPQPEPVALPPRDTIDYVEAAATLESMPDSTLKALLRDSMVDELCLRRSGNLALSATPQKQYTIVKVRAKQLGYSLKEIGNGATLGRYIHQRIPVAYQEMVGRYPVYHYEITPELDTAIHTFFGA
jgi:prophage antirepressor-like protein